MAKKLFVGGLAWATTDESLRQAFEPFGELVEVKVIRDKETNRSRGFGFITFAEDSAAEDAIAQMQGAKIEGRAIRLDKADENRPRANNNNKERNIQDRRESKEPREYREPRENYESRDNRRESHTRYNHDDYAKIYADEDDGGRRNRGSRKNKPYRNKRDEDRW